MSSVFIKITSARYNKIKCGNTPFSGKFKFFKEDCAIPVRCTAQRIKMKLNQKEVQLITELKSQEELCVKKYDFYAKQAKDPELKNLFKKLLKYEQTHYDMLDSLSKGTVPQIKTKTPLANKYEPKTGGTVDQAGKEFDKFLCTDVIATEKYVATAYNDDLFYFCSPEVRNVLNAIMTDEQNHAEMIWKYKVANKMTA